MRTTFSHPPDSGFVTVVGKLVGVECTNMVCIIVMSCLPLSPSARLFSRSMAREPMTESASSTMRESACEGRGVEYLLYV